RAPLFSSLAASPSATASPSSSTCAPSADSAASSASSEPPTINFPSLGIVVDPSRRTSDAAVEDTPTSSSSADPLLTSVTASLMSEPFAYTPCVVSGYASVPLLTTTLPVWAIAPLTAGSSSAVSATCPAAQPVMLNTAPTPRAATPARPTRANPRTRWFCCVTCPAYLLGFQTHPAA